IVIHILTHHILTYLSFNIIIFFLYHLFFNETPTTEIYTLSLHDALPISARHTWRQTCLRQDLRVRRQISAPARRAFRAPDRRTRSEEHTSELQSRGQLVCRLLLEKKKLV